MENNLDWRMDRESVYEVHLVQPRNPTQLCLKILHSNLHNRNLNPDAVPGVINAMLALLVANTVEKNCQ
jgi:hypothetical protein